MQTRHYCGWSAVFRGGRLLTAVLLLTLVPRLAAAEPEIWLYGDVWIHSTADENGDVTVFANASGYTNDYAAPLELELYFLNPSSQTLGYVLESGYGEAHAFTQYLLSGTSQEGDYRTWTNGLQLGFTDCLTAFPLKFNRYQSQYTYVGSWDGIAHYVPMPGCEGKRCATLEVTCHFVGNVLNERGWFTKIFGAEACTGRDYTGGSGDCTGPSGIGAAWRLCAIPQ